MVDNIINMKIEFILKEAENIYGIEKCINILRNYDAYIKLRLKEQINFGNYNILIRDNSAYDASEKLVDIIWEILKSNLVVTTKYKYLTTDEIRKMIRDKEEISEEIFVIDSKRNNFSMHYMKIELKDLIEKYPNKIYIIVDEDSNAGEINAILGDNLAWTMEIEKINKDNKINYIEKTMKENKIEIDSNSSFVNCLSEEPYWKVKNELVNILLECKIKNINRITDDTVQKELKREYYKKTIDNSKEGSALEELDSLIGIDEVKKQIYQILNYLKVNKNRGNMPMLHMCFLGNPGTGKTTVARIVGKIFAEMQILSDEKKFIEAQRADLIGKYVGQTAPKTLEIVKKADGGVLFIDEAYSIASYVQDEGGRDFGAECISTLLKEMEDKRDSLCVIMAGYSKEMNHMLKVNPGFESRIQFKINFPDYSEEELYEIFKNMVKEEKYQLTKNIKQELLEYFKEEKKQENFANARSVRNMFEKVKFEQADRIVKNNESNINLIKKEDVQNAINRLKLKENVKKKIGFAC